MTWLPAFLLTLAIEVPLALAILRARGTSRARIALVVALATIISHPLLTFVILPYFPGSFVTNVLAGEVVVVAIESIVLRVGLAPIRWPYAIAASATLNAASYLVGLAFFNA
jgi:hypothetical protein